ncbi:MAG: CHASE domain-containing protein [Phycisphaerales bacterium]|nr:CHASE domain-containing protein [Phycisphaerales bacterium]
MLRTRTAITGRQVAQRIEQYIHSRLAVLQAVYDEPNDTIDSAESAFRARATSVLNSFPEFQAINWIDADHVIRWVTPEERNPGVVGADLSQHAVAGPCINRAAERNAPCATPPIELLQGGRGFATYIPAGAPGEHAGFINGVFRIESLLEACLTSSVTQDFDYVIMDDAGEIRRSGLATQEADAPRIDTPHAVRVADRIWHLALIPKKHQIPTNAMAIAIGGLGCALALALGFGTHRLLSTLRAVNNRTREIRAIYDAYPDIQLRIRLDRTILEHHGKAEGLLPRNSVVGQHVCDVFSPAASDAIVTALSNLPASGREHCLFGVPDEHPNRHYEARLVPFGDDEALVIVRDVTERVHADERQRRMMAELDHRVKNTLAAVLSLSDQTAMTTDSQAAFRTTFAGRIRSLARTHDALAARRWTAVDLRRTIESIVLGDVHLTGRVHLTGEDMELGPEAANPLSLTLHELKTNALKYGALSGSTGDIDIRWSRTDDDAHVVITWSEAGGPPVDRDPTPGLGLALIRGFIQHELGGTVDLDFQPAGLTCRIRIPIRRGSAQKPEAAGLTAEP